MTLKEKCRVWLKKQLDPGDDKIDVVGLALAALTGLLLFFAVFLFCYEVAYVHKFRYYSPHTWHVLLRRPDLLLVLMPALNLPLLVMRARSRNARQYRRWTLAAALVLLVSAVILVVGCRLFYAFSLTLP